MSNERRPTLPDEPGDGATEAKNPESSVRVRGDASHELPSVVPRSPREGFERALDELKPSVVPAGAAADAQAVPAREADTADAPASNEGSHPGLLTAVLSRPEVAHDPGAQAAYRGIPRRSPRSAQPALSGGGPDAERARAELLEHLAESAQGATRAELLCAAAEHYQRLGEHGRERPLYERAQSANPSDVVALRELRKQALLQGDRERVRELLALEAALPLDKAERALQALSRAELELHARGDMQAAEQAARESFELQPSVVAALLQYELLLRTGRLRKAADMLARAAALLPEPGAHARAAFLLEAGRLLLRVGDAASALPLFERAHAAEPEAFDAALAAYRAARALGDIDAALAALERVQAALPEHAPAAEELRRLRARSLAVHGREREGLRVLGRQSGKVGLRLQARLAEQLGDRKLQRAALEAYVQVAGGSDRALGLLGLAEVDAAAGDLGGAAAKLREAQTADSRLTLVRAMQAALTRAAGSGKTPLPRNDDPRGFDETLEAAARLAADTKATARELELLTAVEAESPSAAQLALDAALELGALREVVARLQRETERAPAAQRVGIELALAELRAEHAAAAAVALPVRESTGQSVLEFVHRIHDSGGDARALGTLWLELAGKLRGEAAAAAATLAGDYLGESGGSREAYERALAALPGYAPACWALEPSMSGRDDHKALQRLHASLARTSDDPLERAARSLRVAYLSTRDRNEDAESRLREAAQLAPNDALLWDRAPSGDAGPPAIVLAELLEDGGHGGQGALAALAKLRAATFYEEAGEPARAAVLYRSVLDQHGAENAHAALGLERTLAHAGLAILLVERLEREAKHASSSNRRTEALERLASIHTARGDARRAEHAFRQLLELAPEHVGALRALSRQALARTDLEQLASHAERLARHERDPAERAAQLRLFARCREAQGLSMPPLGEDAIGLGLPFVLGFEHKAREAADALATGAAVLRICNAHIGDAFERASYALRAAEIVERVSVARAVDALAPFADAVPNHTLAHETLGRLRHAAGDAEGAARAYEQAGAGSPSPLRAARQYYRAAVLWQESVGDDARARRALESVVAIDPSHRDAFLRLSALLRSAEDSTGLSTLLEKRIVQGGDAQLVSDLHIERARLALRAGDQASAKTQLRAALELVPGRVQALREVAELHLQSGEFREAAEALIKVARLAEEPQLLRDVFLTLGRIYTERLPDLRRAEIAYARAVALDPNDKAAVEHLFRVFRERREYDKALRACDRLLDLAADDAEYDRRTVELSSVLEDKGEIMRAERALNDRREQRPSSGLIITALSDLYARQHDQPALLVHLDRSIHALRAGIVANPDDGAALIALCDSLARRGRTQAAEVIAALACDFGVADTRAEQLAAHVAPLGGQAFTPPVIERVWPEALHDASSNLLAWLEPKMDELLPFAPQKQLQKPWPRVLELAVESARACLEIPNLICFTFDGNSCVPLQTKPPTIAIGRSLLTSCDATELGFLVLRAAAIARYRLCAAVRAEPEALAALFSGAETPPDAANPSATPGTESKLSARQRRDLVALLHAAQKPRALSASELRRLVLELGARIALSALGHTASALSALAQSAAPSGTAGYEGHDLGSALARSPEARSLLAFALSDAYVELRAL